MKATKTFLILFTLLISSFSFSQISGKCIQKDGTPIIYANIIVRGKNIGTVTNDNGKFEINDSRVSKKDTIIISHINYEIITISLSNLPKEIYLRKKTF